MRNYNMVLASEKYKRLLESANKWTNRSRGFALEISVYVRRSASMQDEKNLVKRVLNNIQRMSLPEFDESTRAEALPYEVFRWLSETAMYARSTSGTADEVYDSLKIVLRLLAVRNPNAQSQGIRKALGSLIESISAQPDSEKTCLELLGLLIRMVDAKQDSRYDSMKHLALSGLGYFMNSNRFRMRQMSVNVFVICVDALKVCPPVPETLLYRNTILRTMRQCVTPTIDEASIRFAVKFSRNMIENADTESMLGVQTLIRSFELMAEIFTLPGAKSLHKKIDRFESLFAIKGSISTNKAVRQAAARFYFVVLQEFSGQDFQHNVLKVVGIITKSTANKNYGCSLTSSARVETLVHLLELLIATQQTDRNFEAQLDQWLAAALLQLDSYLVTPLFVDSIIKRKLVGEFPNLDIVSVLIRQLSLSQTPNSLKSNSKSKGKIVKPQLESVLACLTNAIAFLGHSIQPVASSIHQATLGLILNGNQVQSDADMASIVRCLVSLVKVTPTLLIPTIELCLKQMEIPTTDDGLHLRISYVLGPVIALTKPLSLYSDESLSSRVMLIAFQKLQEVRDFFSFSTGWTLMNGILSLGSQEVKPLVPQLLLMLPTHLSSESPEVLEKTLTGALFFLIHNVPLLTPDVTNRLGEMLNKLWARIEHTRLNLKIMRRLLQCYHTLLTNTKFEKYPSSLLMRYVAHLTSPKAYSKDSGVQIESAMTTSNSKEKDANESRKTNLIGDNIFASRMALENGLSSFSDFNSTIRSYGNDVDYSIFYLFLGESSKSADSEHIPTDVYTSTVDLAILVCSSTLPLQPERIQESVFDALLSNLKDSMNTNTARKSVVVLNSANLVQHMLQCGIQIAERIVTMAISTLKLLLSCPYLEARKMAAVSCGLLSKNLRNSSFGTQTLPSLAKDLLETSLGPSVNKHLRSGSILALGHILESWSQTSLIEATFRVYDALILDADSQIHLATIESMKHSLLSPDLVDQKYVKHTLKALVSTYLLESHINSVEYREQTAETLVQVVSRFGPLLSSENQEVNRKRIICLSDQLQLDSESSIRVLAWNSLIELFFYARKGITWQIFIRRWTDVIVSPNSVDEELEAALNGLLVLVKLSARSIFSVAGNSLEYALWLTLDRNPNNKTLRKLLTIWLSQTLDDSNDIRQWIIRLSSIVMRPRYFFTDKLEKSLGQNKSLYESEYDQKKASVRPTAVAADEDVSLGVKSDDTNNELFSWESRRFALDMLTRILSIDLENKSAEEKAVCVTTRNVGDLIKIAFTTSTSQILGLQFAGLTFLDKIIENLGDSNDPDFQNISILEQYQVQIASALTPAFSLESSPGLALVALGTTATFLGSSIVKTKEKLGRLLKILEESLESAIKVNEFRLGDLQLSSNAAKALKIAVLAVWAQIKISSESKSHLRDLVSPHEEDLRNLWVHAIMTYGRLQADVDGQWGQGNTESIVDQISEIQFKSLMKPIFKISWLKFIHAISLLDVLSKPSENMNLLVVLCGLCFQELASTLKNAAFAKTIIGEPSDEMSDMGDLSAPQEGQSLISYRCAVLKALTCILTPEVSRVLVDSSVNYIEENIPILYRIMLVGCAEDQIYVLTIARNLVAGQPDTDDKVDHFFEILKISVLPLRNLFPQLIDANAPQRKTKLEASQVQLLRHTLNAVIDIAQVFRDVIKTDLWVCLLKAFEELNHREPAVVAPSFKRFLEILSAQVELRGVGFVVDALTVSLKRAVESESIMEGVFISTAILCTNSSSLVGDPAIKYAYEFGLRVSTILNEYLDLLNDNTYPTDDQHEDAQKLLASKSHEILVLLQLVVAVFRSSSSTDAGKAFAYGCLPSLCQLVASHKGPIEAKKRAATSLTIYAVLDGSVQCLALIIPTFLTLAGSEIEQLCRGMLLQIVAKQSVTFKETVWTMDASDRDICQGLLADRHSANEELVDEESYDESDGEITLTTFS